MLEPNMKVKLNPNRYEPGDELWGEGVVIGRVNEVHNTDQYVREFWCINFHHSQHGLTEAWLHEVEVIPA